MREEEATRESELFREYVQSEYLPTMLRRYLAALRGAQHFSPNLIYRVVLTQCAREMRGKLASAEQLSQCVSPDSFAVAFRANRKDELESVVFTHPDLPERSDRDLQELRDKESRPDHERIPLNMSGLFSEIKNTNNPRLAVRTPGCDPEASTIPVVVYELGESGLSSHASYLEQIKNGILEALPDWEAIVIRGLDEREEPIDAQLGFNYVCVLLNPKQAAGDLNPHAGSILRLLEHSLRNIVDTVSVVNSVLLSRDFDQLLRMQARAALLITTNRDLRHTFHFLLANAANATAALLQRQGVDVWKMLSGDERLRRLTEDDDEAEWRALLSRSAWERYLGATELEAVRGPFGAMYELNNLISSFRRADRYLFEGEYDSEGGVEPFNLRSHIENVVAILERLYQERTIKFCVDSDCTDLQVRTRVQAKLVIGNLLLNAAQHSKAVSSVGVWLSRDCGWVSIEIENEVEGDGDSRRIENPHWLTDATTGVPSHLRRGEGARGRGLRYSKLLTGYLTGGHLEVAFAPSGKFVARFSFKEETQDA